MIMTSLAFGQPAIKPPNVSGQFYDADPVRLKRHIAQLLAKARTRPYPRNVDILIVPHAGYVYSGPVAAEGFQAVRDGHYRTVIVLAPSHYVPFKGIALASYEGFQTPLGVIPVDQSLVRTLTDSNRNITVDDRVFEREHSLEVELPFLQGILKDFSLVPVLVGQPDGETMAAFARRLAEALAGRDDVLIVVSTDLSHYHDDQTAKRMDRDAVEAVRRFDLDALWRKARDGEVEMCGLMPVMTALVYARLSHINKSEVLRMATSGDVTGERDRVVGYASVVLYRQEEKASEDRLTSAQKQRLLRLARETIETFVRHGRRLKVHETDPRLLKKEGAFVTVQEYGQLRGCIGQVVAHQPLYLTVQEAAIAAVSEDPRFPPVTPDELDDLRIEISVLSQPRRIKSPDEFILGKHGVIVRQGRHQGLLLPQVAETTGWDKERFLSELCVRKAGLPPDAWKSPQTILEVFTADVFSE